MCGFTPVQKYFQSQASLLGIHGGADLCAFSAKAKLLHTHTFNIPNYSCTLTTGRSGKPKVKFLHAMLHFLPPILTRTHNIHIASTVEFTKEHTTGLKLNYFCSYICSSLILASSLSFSSFKYNKREDCLCLILLLIRFCSSSFFKRIKSGRIQHKRINLFCCQTQYSGAARYFKC